MTKCSRVFRRAALPGVSRSFFFSVRVLAVLILRDARQPCANRKAPAPKVVAKSPTSGDLLYNDLLLLRVHSALRRLGGHRNHVFSGRQWRHEVMEPAIRV